VGTSVTQKLAAQAGMDEIDQVFVGQGFALADVISLNKNLIDLIHTGLRREVFAVTEVPTGSRLLFRSGMATAARATRLGDAGRTTNNRLSIALSRGWARPTHRKLRLDCITSPRGRPEILRRDHAG